MIGVYVGLLVLDVLLQLFGIQLLCGGFVGWLVVLLSICGLIIGLLFGGGCGCFVAGRFGFCCCLW